MISHFRRTFSFTIWSFGTALVLTPLALSAQRRRYPPPPPPRSYDHPLSVGFQGGLTMPTGDFGDCCNTGWNAGAFIQYRPVNSVLGIRGEVQYQSTDMNQFYLQSFPDYTNGLTGNFGILNADVDAVLEVYPRQSPVGWYALGGVGSYRIDTSVQNVDVTVSSTTTDFGFNAGGGLLFRLGGSTLFAEARWHWVTDYGNGNSADAHYNFVPISFGIRF